MFKVPRWVPDAGWRRRAKERDHRFHSYHGQTPGAHSSTSSHSFIPPPTVQNACFVLILQVRIPRLKETQNNLNSYTVTMVQDLGSKSEPVWQIAVGIFHRTPILTTPSVCTQVTLSKCRLRFYGDEESPRLGVSTRCPGDADAARPKHHLED